MPSYKVLRRLSHDLKIYDPAIPASDTVEMDEAMAREFIVSQVLAPLEGDELPVPTVSPFVAHPPVITETPTLLAPAVPAPTPSLTPTLVADGVPVPIAMTPTQPAPSERISIDQINQTEQSKTPLVNLNTATDNDIVALPHIGKAALIKLKRARPIASLDLAKSIAELSDDQWGEVSLLVTV